jgi:hypothetical protein
MGAYKDRRIALKRLRILTNDSSMVLSIHYSQLQIHEGEDSLSPLISAIVVRSLDDSLYEHFSIHLEADKANIPLEEIENNYRELEFWVLKSFNDFVKRHKNKLWVHWNMQNVHFGFEAIKHRFYKLVEGTRERFEEIPSNNKFNLNYLLESIYGESYIMASDKLSGLSTLNNGNVLDRCYLSLDTEALEFERKNFNSVLNSLDFKVNFICRIIRLLNKNKLKVENRNFYAIFSDVVTSPMFTFIGWLIGLIGLVIGFFALR